MIQLTYVHYVCGFMYGVLLLMYVYTLLYNILNCICAVSFELFSTVFVPRGVFHMAFDRGFIAIPGSI